MLKPALAKGLLQCIGATTIKEYKQYIEADKALARRFQAVKLEQPSVEDTIAILKGLQKKYERHHQIEYSDDAIKVAAELSDRYITDRFLPDKAIDLVDEAGAAKRLRVIYTPPHLRKLETKRAELFAKKSEAFNDRDFEAMANYQMQISSIENELESARKLHSASISDKDRLVTQDDIAAVVSRVTGIPVAKMVAAESKKMRDLESLLQQRLIGQEHAIKSISNAIRRNRSGLRIQGKPIASFLFLGPTGVGKTELAKALAEQILDDESKIIRLDMSEYMERHNVARLIGSPPGYVGYGEGGQLTEKVKQNPYSVVLLDEFEKAHPDVYNLLLQVLDEGWLTDAEGQKVNFQNCIIIGTSNIGSQILTDRKRPIGMGNFDEDFSSDEENKAVMKEVKKYLRPEFINRLDEIIIFNRLGRTELREILELQVKALRQRLATMHMELEISEAAKEFILQQIDTTNFGARPLKRKLEQMVENKIASTLIEISDEDRQGVMTVELTNDKADISVHFTPRPEATSL
jgi:ATP-dependent Clp protease ATP-binding subunit ClpC